MNLAGFFRSAKLVFPFALCVLLSAVLVFELWQILEKIDYGSKKESAPTIVNGAIPQGQVNHLVINEIYPWPDGAHGKDCMKDTPKTLFSADKGISGLTRLLKQYTKISYKEPCNEWIEIYNPTNKPVSIFKWRIDDDLGAEQSVFTIRRIPSHGFAILTQSPGVFDNFWTHHFNTVIVGLDNTIGNGLGDKGDHLRLLNVDKRVIDAVSWGNDSTLQPHVLQVPGQGQSLRRIHNGYDTATASDFMIDPQPMPGTVR